METECGDIQPGRKIWSDVFYIAVADTGESTLSGHLYAGNLPKPKPFTLTIKAHIKNTQMSVDDLWELYEAGEDDCSEDLDKDE